MAIKLDERRSWAKDGIIPNMKCTVSQFYIYFLRNAIFGHSNGSAQNWVFKLEKRNVNDDCTAPTGTEMCAPSYFCNICQKRTIWNKKYHFANSQPQPEKCI